MTRRATDPNTLARTITLPGPRQMSEAELLRCVIEAAGCRTLNRRGSVTCWRLAARPASGGLWTGTRARSIASSAGSAADGPPLARGRRDCRRRPGDGWLDDRRRCLVTRDELGRVARDNADEPRPGRPDLAAIRAREQAATPGPWRWRANLSVHHVWLGSLAQLKTTVMNFHRWGMQEAQPHFNTANVMGPPAYIIPEPHNAWNATGIDHPDARFIEHAREDIPALLAYCERLEAASAAQTRASQAEQQVVEAADAYELAWNANRDTPLNPESEARAAGIRLVRAAHALIEAVRALRLARSGQ